MLKPPHSPIAYLPQEDALEESTILTGVFSCVHIKNTGRRGALFIKTFHKWFHGLADSANSAIS